MMFENPEIALDDLPGTEDLDWQSLHPRYARRIRLQTGLVLAAIGVAIAIASFVPGLRTLQVVTLWVQLIVIGAALLIWPTFSIPRCGYVVRDKDIVFRKGVIWQSVTAVPFNRIQHVETSSTPFDRRYGLATLQLFTAGGSSGDLRIDGLGRDVAEQLRIFILDRVGVSIESA